MAEKQQEELAQIFAQMSGVLFSEETTQTALDLVSRLAHETLAGTAGAGVTLTREGSEYTASYSDEISKRADTLQYELDEGPCLSTFRERRTHRIDDVSSETRWPRWCAAVQELGMASVVSAPLMVRDESIGAVKVYSRNKSNYDERDEAVMQMFGDQAAIVLANAQAFTSAGDLTEQLKEALKTREMIGEAKGILMEREGVSSEEAFAMLRQASQNSNLKLRDIARELAERTVKRHEQAEDAS
ncbi:MAG: GAF and ANTAR domain-containing protein [Actinomycetota bacterium]|nr:GAF and ANTAR domain-containing protein [Actinomycetota bacterium]